MEAAQERAKLELGYTELRAPFAGFVSAVFAEAFEEVKPQEPVVRLVDPTEIEMVVNVPESLISYAPGQWSTSRPPSTPSWHRDPGRAGRGRQGAVRDHAHLPGQGAAHPAAGRSILPGMAGRLRGKPGPEIARQTEGVVIPLSAAFSPDDATGSFVWVVNDAAKTVHRVTGDASASPSSEA